MGADSCTIYYGVRLSFGEEDLEAFEERTHPVIRKCREFGLHFWWGKDPGNDERWFVMIGSSIGSMGLEEKLVLEVPQAVLAEKIATTTEKLRRAGFTEIPGLQAVYGPDF